MLIKPSIYFILSIIYSVSCLGDEEIKPLIIGGTSAGVFEFPWQISLQINNLGHICGGSIIKKNFVITAGHCVDAFDIKEYKVHAGSINKKKPLSIHNVTNIYIHQNYTKTEDGIPSQDIAILKISPMFKFNAKIQPVRLPAQNTINKINTLLTVTGWGETKTGDYPDILEKVKVPIANRIRCNEAYKDYGGIAKGTICAGFYKGGKDSCRGDSGGPLVLRNELRGIVSWGSAICGEPGGFYGVYTDVAYYRKWIYNIAFV